MNEAHDIDPRAERIIDRYFAGEFDERALKRKLAAWRAEAGRVNKGRRREGASDDDAGENRAAAT